MERPGGWGALDEMMLTCDSSDVPLLMAQRNQQHNQTGLMFEDRRPPPHRPHLSPCLHFQVGPDKDQSWILILRKKQIKKNSLDIKGSMFAGVMK